MRKRFFLFFGSDFRNDYYVHKCYTVITRRAENRTKRTRGKWRVHAFVNPNKCGSLTEMEIYPYGPLYVLLCIFMRKKTTIWNAHVTHGHYYYYYYYSSDVQNVMLTRTLLRKMGFFLFNVNERTSCTDFLTSKLCDYNI